MLISACSSSGTEQQDGTAPAEEPPAEESSETVAAVTPGTATTFPPAPPTPPGPLSDADIVVLDTLTSSLGGGLDEAVALLAQSEDPRVLWVVADLLRFVQGSSTGAVLTEIAQDISGATFNPARPWGDLTDHLIAWDIEEPTDYVRYKATIFTTVDDRWEFVFADPTADIDYRILSWGGVFIDDRPLGDTQLCARGCIPSLDDPAFTTADRGDWYPDSAIVFGVEIGDDIAAFPKNIMEIHEMVNATIGGRRIAMPYCTLCGSAQVFFTDAVDNVDRPPVLRTSGLLSRSNKVMYDLDSASVFDTFTGEAISGPLRELGVVLPQATVVTTTWADWRETHPDTLIVAEDGGIGRSYNLDPLRGRDDDGPIFPIGNTDPRLEVQTPVVGVITPVGTPVAFPADAARSTLRNGEAVEAFGVRLMLDGDGLKATFNGEGIASHQAFWFAWSQFHPATELWLP
ncbi:MAG: DUF3179 domain-containing (seleno)protein [Acidimicrobiales bacterium]